MNNSYGPLYRAAVAVAFVLGSASACTGSAQSERKPFPLTLSGSVGGMSEREAGVTDHRDKRAQSTAYGGAAAPKEAARQAPRVETSGPYAGMVRVRGGTFQMGREGGLFGLGGAEPVHRARLDDFYLGESEASQEAFQRVMGFNPSANEDPQHPVENVSWWQAQEYCARLGQRLPTEAQWEYAARAGGQWRDIFVASYYLLHEYANYAEFPPERATVVGAPFQLDKDGYAFVAPVAQFKTNAWGFHDLYGNVAEWVSDWYAPYRAEDAHNPPGPADGAEKIVRGGAFYSHGSTVTPYYRDARPPDDGHYSIGFRCAADAP
ncbi:MAG: formylglycine-generating enzyme family protein [SAR324 cluster bacterium]|nr:formylglycine-generating enzyme family protein [SAR324 cluster bacterium]